MLFDIAVIRELTEHRSCRGKSSEEWEKLDESLWLHGGNVGIFKRRLVWLQNAGWRGVKSWCWRLVILVLLAMLMSVSTLDNRWSYILRIAMYVCRSGVYS